MSAPIGAAVRRTEDRRFLTGKGHYTDDINRPGQLHAVFVRSPHAHAEITRIDTARAKAAPGVAAVYTGADLQAAGLGSLPCGWAVKFKDGSPMKEPPHPVLAQGKVRHVGDPIAIVIAATKEQASEAADLVAVAYKTLPAVTDAAGQEVHRRRASEAGDELRRRPIVYAVGGIVLDQVAFPQDDDAIGERHRLDLVVGDVDDGVSELLVQLLDLDPHLGAQQRIEVGKRLVEKERLGLAHDGAAHSHALALAAGELARLAFEQVLDL